MSVMAILTPSTAQSMYGKIVHFLSTVNTKVGPTQGRTQPKACGHPDGVVILVQSPCRNGQMFSHAPDSLPWKQVGEHVLWS